MLSHILLVAGLLQAISVTGSAQQPQPIGKVIGSKIQGNSTQLYLEVNRKLVPGRTVKLGNGASAVVGDLLSDRYNIFYYSASLPKQQKLPAGLDVFPEGTAIQAIEMPQRPGYTFWKKTFGTWSAFKSKKYGEVTAIQGDRALIDRGSMHEVRERDLYAVYDSSGKYKGMVEMRGIGDFQSQGKLYNALEDIGRRNALTTIPGDKTVFLGQRKLFNLHAVFGTSRPREKVLDRTEVTYGGGLLWTITLPDGWGVELLFGVYRRELDLSVLTPIDSFSYRSDQTRHVSNFWAPIWVRKNLFYPFPVSPYFAAGLAYFNGLLEESVYAYPTSTAISGERSGFVPMFGGGLEFFPGRFLHPRLEIRHFESPRIVAVDHVYKTRSTFYSFGISTSW